MLFSIDYVDPRDQALCISVEGCLVSLNFSWNWTRHRQADLALGQGLSYIAGSGLSFPARCQNMASQLYAGILIASQRMHC